MTVENDRRSGFDDDGGSHIIKPFLQDPGLFLSSTIPSQLSTNSKGSSLI